MDYNESKIKDAIREACVKAIEVNHKHYEEIRKTNNPYYAISCETQIHEELNKISNSCYSEISGFLKAA